MTEATNPLAALSDEEVRIIPPDYTLKKIVGENVDIAKIFSSENVEKAQELINSHKDSFLEWVVKDIETLEESYQAVATDLAGYDPHLKKLARAAFVIKSQAGTFGFGLATQVAKSLDDFCNQSFKPLPEHVTVLRKHIDTLSLIFKKQIAGDGGDVGKEIAGSLAKLTQKYKAS